MASLQFHGGEPYLLKLIPDLPQQGNRPPIEAQHFFPLTMDLKIIWLLALMSFYPVKNNLSHTQVQDDPTTLSNRPHSLCFQQQIYQGFEWYSAHTPESYYFLAYSPVY